MKRSKQEGFTLVEIMIAIAIVGILAAVAVPQYQSYTQKQQVAGAAAIAAAWQTAVEQCIQENGGDLSNCDGGSEGIQANIAASDTTKPPSVYALTTSNGIITVTSDGETKAGSRMQIIYTPTVANGFTSWTMSGTGCDTPSRGITCN